jgi:hypothetical protein
MSDILFLVERLSVIHKYYVIIDYNGEINPFR